MTSRVKVVWLTTRVLELSLKNTPVATARFPAFSKLDIHTRKGELSRMFERSVRYTTLLIVPVAISITVLEVWKVLHEVVAYNGSRITVTREVIDHIERKHPQMLSVAGLSAERLLSLMIQTIESPTEVTSSLRLKPLNEWAVKKRLTKRLELKHLP